MPRALCDAASAEIGRAFLKDRFGSYYGSPDVVFAIEKGGSIVGAVAFHTFTGFDIEATVCGQNCWTRGIWRDLAAYVYNRANCSRVTIHCRSTDAQTQRLAMKFGFVFEGIRRRYYGTEDAAMFGMLRSECRWIGREK